MFGFNSDDWKGYFGLQGLPGIMAQQQKVAGQLGLFGGGGENNFYGGGATDLSSLLAQMRGQGGGTSQAQGPYIGGEGLI